MKKRGYYIGLLIVVIFSLRVFAVDKTFTSSGSIFDGETYYTVYAYNNGTVVSMYGGTVNGDFNLHDSSSVNIHGGTISMDLNAFDNSYIELLGGIIEDDIYLYGTSEIKLHNGIVHDNFQFNDSTKGWIYDGTVLGNLGVHDSSILSIYGGNTDYVLWADGSSYVNIYGYDLVATSAGGALGHGQILGYWEDNTAFVINLDTATTYTHLILHEIPEPASAAIMILGTVWMAAKRKYCRL